MPRIKRKKRIPVSGNRDVLTVKDKDPNFVYRFVNDIDGRIEKFLDAGYEFVERAHEIGDVSVENSNPERRFKNVGKGVTAYLMRIPKEFYEEDQEAKQKELNEREADMKRNLNSNQDGRYGSVTIT